MAENATDYARIEGMVGKDIWASFSAAQKESRLRLTSALLGLAAGVWSILQFMKHDDTRLKQPRPGQVPGELADSL